MPDDAIERPRARELLKRAFLARSIGYVDLPTSNLVSIPCAIDALLLAFASQQAPEGWRPIDTAWQAGSNPVIVTDGQSVHGGAWWHSREETWLGCDGIVPTHWRPLPAPPAMLDAAPSVGEGV